MDDLKNNINIDNLESILLTTEKDYCRIPENLKNNFHYLKVELDIENKEYLIKLIDEKI